MINETYRLTEGFLLQAGFSSCFGLQVPRTGFVVSLYTNLRTMVILLGTKTTCTVLVPLADASAEGLTRYIIAQQPKAGRRG